MSSNICRRCEGLGWLWINTKPLGQGNVMRKARCSCSEARNPPPSIMPEIEA